MSGRPMAEPGQRYPEWRAGDYARYRPRYPEALFDWLTARAPSPSLAWDCASGTGQAAASLVTRFHHVVATDLSLGQLSHATAHPGIRYVVARAEQVPLRHRTVDLITVAQALHWFDLASFYGEVERVAKPQAVVAAWCYGLCSIGADLDRVLRGFYTDTVGPYWSERRRHVATGYADLSFPFDRLSSGSFSIEAHWTRGELLGYVGTWSAVAAYRAARGVDPMVPLTADVEAHWSEPMSRKRITWPIVLHAGVVR